VSELIGPVARCGNRASRQIGVLFTSGHAPPRPARQGGHDRNASAGRGRPDSRYPQPDGSPEYRAVMSINPTLPQLAETLARYRFAYLVTIGNDARTHVVPVHPVFAGNILSVHGLGRKTQAHMTTQRLVTLVWPPTDPSDYSLIIDGVGALGDDELAVTPTRAVLHRPAQRQIPTTGQGCQSDCVELPTAAETANR
jgi:hypothetical protein